MHHSQSNITRRVISSASALAARTMWERGTTLIATIVLARLLVPSDVGAAAIVVSTTTVAGTLIDGGISTHLLRQPDDVSDAQLRAARAIQFRACALAMVLVVVIALAGVRYGPLILLSAIKLPTKPTTLRIRIRLQRAVEFQGLALSEGLAQLASAASAVALVMVDRGPGAIVGADVIGALVGAAYVGARLRRKVPPLAETPSLVTHRGLLREALPYQGFTVVSALRDLTTAVFVSALVGVRDLGLLQFGYRLLSPVMIVFQSVGQLSVPVGTHILRRDDRANRQVQSGFIVAGTITAVILATVSAPAHWYVPVLFGAKWMPAVSVVGAIALALVISGPLNSFGIGLLVAASRPGVASAAVAGCTAWFMVTMIALRPLGGVDAGAAAWVGMAVIEAVIVIVACRRLLGIGLARVSIVPPLIFAAAYVAGRAAGEVGHGWLSGTALAAAAALAVSGTFAAMVALQPLRALLATARSPVPAPPYMVEPELVRDGVA